MQTIFSYTARGSEVDAALAHNIQELVTHGDVDQNLAAELVTGVISEMDVLKTAIELAAPEWSWDRMDALSRCILLIGAYEILHRKDAPPAVVMNEAIEIAKEYGTEESKKFVNGVLNALAHRK
jgi:transcription antitermination protein NusB